MAKEVESKYFIDAAAKVLDVLESFTSPEEELSTTEVAARTGLSYSSAFRLLYTLQRRGYVMRPSGKKRFLLVAGRKRLRIGYAALGKIRFAKEVTWGMISAARRRGITLLVKDNELNPAKALLNADELIAEKIDLLIEHQWHEATGNLIATKCHQAGIPVVAVSFTQPGAYYFGGDDYVAGGTLGDFLCRFVQEKWNGAADACYVLLGDKMRSTQETRRAGLLRAIEQGLPDLSPVDMHTVAPAFAPHEGYNFAKAFPERLRSRAKRILIAALTDPLAIGAERAIVEAGLKDRVVIAGLGGALDARSRIKKGGPFKASVAYFPGDYGERVMALALRILEGEKIPLATYTDHVMLTADNLQEYYPEERRRSR